MLHFQELRSNFRVKNAWPLLYHDEHSSRMSAPGFEEAESCDSQQIALKHNIGIRLGIIQNGYGRKTWP